MNKKIFVCYLSLFSVTLFCAEEWSVRRPKRKKALQIGCENHSESYFDLIRKKQINLDLQFEKLKKISPQLAEKVAQTCVNYSAEIKVRDVDGDENMGVGSEGYSNILEGIATISLGLMSEKQRNLDLQLEKPETTYPQLVEEIRRADEELSTLKKIADEELPIFLEELKDEDLSIFLEGLKRESKKVRKRKRLKKVKK